MNLKKLVLLQCLLFFAVHASVNAQSGNPYIYAGNDVYLPCYDSCITLHAVYGDTTATGIYTVSQIAYVPHPVLTGNPIPIGVDDKYSDVIPLPFSFCFFESSYTSLVVSDNGIVTFNDTAAFGFCNWNLQSGLQIPTDSFGLGTMNSIMCPYQDLDPTYRGEIYWQVEGTAPNRIMIISFDSVPYFGDPNSIAPIHCSSPLYGSSQVLLYESSNIIEVNITSKDVCTGWNQGRAIEGIQNIDGSRAFAVPGRNNAVWTAGNDAWRFTPSGTSSNMLPVWFHNGSFFNVGNDVVVCPDSTTEYVARMTFGLCSGANVDVFDTVKVIIPTVLSISTTSTGESCTACNDGTITINVSSGNPPYQYTISPSAGTLSGNVFSNLPPGSYQVCVTDSAGCIQCDSVGVGVFTAISQIAGSNGFYFSQNPFHSTTTLHLPYNFSKATLKIYTPLGSLVKSETICGQSVVINREGLRDGIYFISVPDGENEYRGKMVVE